MSNGDWFFLGVLVGLNIAAAGMAFIAIHVGRRRP